MIGGGRVGWLTLAALSSLVIVACSGSGSSDRPEPSVANASIAVTSTAFTDGSAIPTKYSCQGAGTSPDLAWKSVPSSAKSLALVVADPDAPGGTFYHWIVADIPVSTTSVPADASPAGVSANNSTGATGYTPPCPPSGTHHYRFTVYALSKPTKITEGADTDAALDAIDAAAFASGTLVGTYESK